VQGKDAVEKFYTGQGGPLSLRAFAYGIEGKVGYILGGYTDRPGSPDHGKFTLTVRQGEDGRWLIVSDMDSPDRRRQPEPETEAAPGSPEAHQIHGFFKSGFVVQDLDEIYERLKVRKVTLAYDLGQPPGGPYRSFGVRDPEGNLLQFFGR